MSRRRRGERTSARNRQRWPAVAAINCPYGLSPRQRPRRQGPKHDGRQRERAADACLIVKQIVRDQGNHRRPAAEADILKTNRNSAVAWPRMRLGVTLEHAREHGRAVGAAAEFTSPACVPRVFAKAKPRAGSAELRYSECRAQPTASPRAVQGTEGHLSRVRTFAHASRAHPSGNDGRGALPRISPPEPPERPT